MTEEPNAGIKGREMQEDHGIKGREMQEDQG